MNTDWSSYELGGQSFISYNPLLKSGIFHGFAGLPGNYAGSGPDWISLKQEFCSALGVSGLYLVSQVHGNSIIDLTLGVDREAEPRLQADAILAPRVANRPIAFGIRIADCVPILIVWGDVVALIHAGWRGLAGGILQEVCRILNNKQPSAGQKVALIGPCAGANAYEVGLEVVTALAPFAVSKISDSRMDRAMLDLDASTRNILLGCGLPISSIHSCEVCTITSKEFHSYRRDAERSGRNLCFFVPEPKV